MAKRTGKPSRPMAEYLAWLDKDPRYAVVHTQYVSDPVGAEDVGGHFSFDADPPRPGAVLRAPYPLHATFDALIARGWLRQYRHTEWAKSGSRRVGDGPEEPIYTRRSYWTISEAGREALWRFRDAAKKP